MISSINKKRFEYIWHLYNTNTTDKDLPFDKHVPCDPAVWEFPQHLVEYHRLVFDLGRESLMHKEVLDIGCGLSWYLGSMENLVKKYVGVDPDKKSIQYAKIMSKIVDVDSDIRVGSAENILCKADTIMMLSVAHRIPTILDVLKKFQCENIILDCWEEENNINVKDIIRVLKDKSFLLSEQHLYDYFGKEDLGKSHIYSGNRYILHFHRQ